jgi:hypothetical protein
VGLVVLGTESTPAEQPATGAGLPASEADQPWWSTLVAAFSEVGAADGQTQTELESEPQTDPQTDPQDEPAPDDGP